MNAFAKLESLLKPNPFDALAALIRSDASVSSAQHNAMEAAAHYESLIKNDNPESLLTMRNDADKWITVHPNGKGNGGGTPALIGEDGTVKGGMGGKFNGLNIKDTNNEAVQERAEKRTRGAVEHGKQAAKAEGATAPKLGKQTDLAQSIKELGGVHLSHAKDTLGDNPQGAWKFAFSNSGKGMDDLATQLKDKGYDIDTDAHDGGVQQLKDMIRDHANGERVGLHHEIENAARHEAYQQSRDALADKAAQRGIVVSKGMTDAAIDHAIQHHDAREEAESLGIKVTAKMKPSEIYEKVEAEIAHREGLARTEREDRLNSQRQRDIDNERDNNARLANSDNFRFGENSEEAHNPTAGLFNQHEEPATGGETNAETLSNRHKADLPSEETSAPNSVKQTESTQKAPKQSTQKITIQKLHTDIRGAIGEPSSKYSPSQQIDRTTYDLKDYGGFYGIMSGKRAKEIAEHLKSEGYKVDETAIDRGIVKVAKAKPETAAGHDGENLAQAPKASAQPQRANEEADKQEPHLYEQAAPKREYTPEHRAAQKAAQSAVNSLPQHAIEHHAKEQGVSTEQAKKDLLLEANQNAAKSAETVAKLAQVEKPQAKPAIPAQPPKPVQSRSTFSTNHPAQEGSTRHPSVAEAHHELSSHAPIAWENEKSVGIANPAYEEAKRTAEYDVKELSREQRDLLRDGGGLTFLPKSEISAHDGKVTGVSHWLAQKNGINTHESNAHNLEISKTQSKSSNELSDLDKNEVAEHLTKTRNITIEKAHELIKKGSESPEGLAKIKEGLGKLREQKNTESELEKKRIVPTNASEESGKINHKSLLWEKHDDYKDARIRANFSGGGTGSQESINLRVNKDGSWEMTLPYGSGSKASGNSGGESEAMKHLPDFVSKTIGTEKANDNWYKRELLSLSPAEGGLLYDYKTGKASKSSDIPNSMHRDFTTATAVKKAQAVSAKTTGATILNVPYANKDEVKAHGARWSPDLKKWYMPAGKELPEALHKFRADSARSDAAYSADECALLDKEWTESPIDRLARLVKQSSDPFAKLVRLMR